MNGGRESHSACFQAFHVAPLRASLKFEGALNPNIAPFAYLPYSLTALLWNRWTSYKEPCFRVASHRVLFRRNYTQHISYMQEKTRKKTKENFALVHKLVKNSVIIFTKHFAVS